MLRLPPAVPSVSAGDVRSKDCILSKNDIMPQICDLHNHVKDTCKLCKALNNGGGNGVWKFPLNTFVDRAYDTYSLFYVYHLLYPLFQLLI